MILSTGGLGHPQVCQRIVQFTKDLLLLDEPKAQRAAAVLPRVRSVKHFARRAAFRVGAARLVIAAPHHRRSSLPLLVAAPRLVVVAPRRRRSSSSPRFVVRSSSPLLVPLLVAAKPFGEYSRRQEVGWGRSGRPAPCRESREEGTAATLDHQARWRPDRV